ncbi:low molecular weight protein-tyrosine-phosphatase [Chryseobacterium binzhouense]|uniref:low molecular weight protein-tyrosine-phosphatase n=1 Tax=Chryseobacterium binzhouense TaxID=2593646 RepID=UPI00118096D9|nr:low molecular weight protein-tyrosine-phosphatase [Chryseobacterium binzhouense]
MKILMVCLGNICRSPLAEGILKSKLLDNFEVHSAGTINMHEGSNPDKRSVEIASKNGINISDQCSRPINPEDLDYYDKIYCMDKKNLQDVLSLAKNEQQRNKISLLMHGLNLEQYPDEVPDPYWSEAEGFEKVFLQINDACEIISKKLIRSQL